MWYDINKTLSHGCFFNFLVGNRGGGKTYGCKRRAISNFIKKGEQFVYIRRVDTEFNELDKFFDDIEKNNEFEGVVFEVKGTTLYSDGKEMGYAIPLSMSSNYKSTPFPNVTMIIFDEFLLDDSEQYKRYLKDEVRRFLELCSTIIRDRDNVVVFFCGNAFSSANPYFLYFKISLPFGSKFFKRGDILLEMVEDVEHIEKMKKTRFGKLIDGTAYGNYAMENKMLNDSNTFIRKRRGTYNYLFTVLYKGETYGFWISYKQGLLSVSQDIDKTCRIVYACTVEDHNENVALIKSLKKSVMFRMFIEYYKVGQVIFDNQKTKSSMMELLGKALY